MWIGVVVIAVVALVLIIYQLGCELMRRRRWRLL
jgi:hypothetical protein